MTVAEINGEPARVEALLALAQVNYGHFTSMQAREGCVRGLDLHLARLVASTSELFSTALDRHLVRTWMRQALSRVHGDATLRVTVYSRAFQRDRPGAPSAPDVLVVAGPARSLAPTPARACTARFAREAPHVKHVGTFGLFHQKRLAQARGYDDVVFVDESGAISEGSIWNIGFHDGEGFVFPDAPALEGVSLQLMREGMRTLGIAHATRRVTIADLGTMRQAFFTNASLPVKPIVAIDAHGYRWDDAVAQSLDASFDVHPWQDV